MSNVLIYINAITDYDYEYITKDLIISFQGVKKQLLPLKYAKFANSKVCFVVSVEI